MKKKNKSPDLFSHLIRALENLCGYLFIINPLYGYIKLFFFHQFNFIHKYAPNLHGCNTNFSFLSTPDTKFFSADVVLEVSMFSFFYSLMLCKISLLLPTSCHTWHSVPIKNQIISQRKLASRQTPEMKGRVKFTSNIREWFGNKCRG